MDDTQIKYFIEAALLAAGQPLSVDQLQKLFDEGSEPEKLQIRRAISNLLEDYADRGLTIKEVASGFRVQIESNMVQRLQKLWDQRSPRYSRAMFETLALITYRQPMTRGEIEEVRGVSVSANIIRTLLEREWIRVVGHRDVPGRPEMFGTTKQFLDYFGLKKLDDLPPLADLSDWESLRVQLDLPAVDEDTAGYVQIDSPAAGATASTFALSVDGIDEGAKGDIHNLGPEERATIGPALSDVALEPIKVEEALSEDLSGSVAPIRDSDTGDGHDHEEIDESLNNA